MASAVRRPVVLIVEDESLLRTSGAELARASRWSKLVAILEARADIPIVFTDIQMPGSMDGLRPARFVRDRWPPIATSGCVTLSEGDLPEGGVSIPKPSTAPPTAEGPRKPGRATSRIVPDDPSCPQFDVASCLAWRRSI
ncbi:response regulator [Bradyrhizobium sp. I1.7.5]|uniref:response regulator n=1 Tax=Bradyrhizobium sp. I1.7.5 TaxID=3156363 RepID=UPI0033916747